MNRRFFGESTLVAFGFAAALTVLVAMGAIAGWRLRAALASGDLYARTWQVLRQTRLVANGLTEAGTGERGYLLTGDPQYLDIYHRALVAIPRDLTHLKELTADNPSQQKRVRRLSVLVKGKLNALKATIEARDRRGFAAARALFRTDRAQGLGRKARRLLAQMEVEENQLLQRRQRQRDDERRQTYLLIAAGSAVSALLMTLAGVVLLRYVRRLRRSERAERESEQRLSVTLSSIGDAVIATNVEGRVTFMNPVAQEMTGWAHCEARGRPLAEVFTIVNEETRAPVPHPVEEVLRRGRIVGLANHTVLIRRDGREIPIDDSAAPIRDGDGELMGVVLVFHDVTERKELQANRERYLLAEAANQAKDDFLAMLSHELRSPLNAMLGWVRLLQRGDQQPEILDRALGVLDRNIATQTKLINELLDLSRVVAGKLKLDFEPVDLAALVRDCADSSRPAAEAKNVALEERVAAGDGQLIVRGDAERLHQVITNLLGNAVKFTPAGGHIVVSLRRVDGEAEITVRDDGEGIPTNFLPHVFERFRQADGRPSRTHGGLGIGLAIVQHLVERHGGRVTAHSAGPHTGATFTVTLPLASAKDFQAPAIEAERGPTNAEARSVLLVEDDADTLEALRISLLQSGARVFAARNAVEALGLFGEHQPALVVSDISMPGGDGYQLIRAIRQRERGRVLAIAMTGLASNEDRRAAIAAGFDEYITKPVDPEKLAVFVRQARAT